MIFESKNNRKTVYKTEEGIAIKPMLHQKNENESSSTNISYYFVNYSKRNNREWVVFTNPVIYGEIKEMGIFKTEAEAVEASRVVNRSMNFLFENIK